jgi:hypothetical protein
LIVLFLHFSVLVIILNKKQRKMFNIILNIILINIDTKFFIKIDKLFFLNFEFELRKHEPTKYALLVRKLSIYRISLFALFRSRYIEYAPALWKQLSLINQSRYSQFAL